MASKEERPNSRHQARPALNQAHYLHITVFTVYVNLMTQEFDDSAKAFLLEILSVHEGEENRISSRDLQLQLTMCLSIEHIDIGFWNQSGHIVSKNFIGERKMRDLLFDLRIVPEGKWIVSSTKGGYFKARNLKELKSYLMPNRAAAKTQFYRTSQQLKNAGLEISTQEMELEYET